MASSDDSGARADGRQQHMRRPALLRIRAVRAAAGSAYVELEDTKVMVSVFGPRESAKAAAFSDMGRLNCNVKYCTFASAASRSSSNAPPSTAERDFSAMLHKALAAAIDLSKFAKTTVDVFALILQSGGGDMAATITCASLALADAGIVMYDLVAAVSASYTRKQVLLDPTSAEESAEDGGLMLSYMAQRKEITQLTMSGEWSAADASEALELCTEACHQIGEEMRACLKQGMPKF